MKNYSIVFSSKTGNTKKLAETIKMVCGIDNMIYYGVPDVKAVNGDIIFAGFWTDKGTCDETMASFLRQLKNKKIFLFGTAGFGGNDAYFNQILARVQKNIDPSNTIIGTYMCQGKMPMSIRARYESLLPQNPDKMQSLINNFDKALDHPDDNDFTKLIDRIQALMDICSDS